MLVFLIAFFLGVYASFASLPVDCACVVTAVRGLDVVEV